MIYEIRIIRDLLPVCIPCWFRIEICNIQLNRLDNGYKEIILRRHYQDEIDFPGTNRRRLNALKWAYLPCYEIQAKFPPPHAKKKNSFGGFLISNGHY